MFSNIVRSSALLLAAVGLLPFDALAAKLKPGQASAQYDTNVYGGEKASILTYPSDWSRNAYTLPVHSHNDYWRDAPVLEALSYGIMSVESDVWLYKDEVYVGHEAFALTKERTFDALTIAPIMKALDQANKVNANYSKADRGEAEFWQELQQATSSNTSTPWTGYFSLGLGASAPIQLLIDIKTDGNATWPAVVKKLQPLRDLGWLTKYENGKLIPGPVTVIGTGNTPINQLAAEKTRDVFFDCPLGKLSEVAYVDPTSGEQYKYNSTLCGIASASFRNFSPKWSGVSPLPDEVRSNLTQAIDESHALSIKTRVWETPEWPKYAKDTINRLLLELGSDWINADDLEDIASNF